MNHLILRPTIKRSSFALKKRFKDNLKPFIQAHRGINIEEPENTIPAFKKAIEYKIDSIELDVWLTKDKIPVVIHGTDKEGCVSPTLNSVGRVNDMTLEEIKKLKTKIGGVTIPTLEEVIILCNETIYINIELKDYQYEDTLNEVLNLIRKYHIEKQICISSFKHQYWEEIKKLNLTKNIEFGFLYDSYDDEPKEVILNSEIDNCSVNLYYKDINYKLIEKAHSLGIGVVSWFGMSDIETDEILTYLIMSGVDVICCNHPKRATELRDQIFL